MIRRWLRDSHIDVKLGIRMLVKHPGLSIVGGAGLAVGVAIGTAFFAFAYSLFHATLPIDGGERIVALENWDLEANTEMRVLALQAPPGASLDNPDTIVESMVDEQRARLGDLLILEDSWVEGADGDVRVLEGVARVERQRLGIAFGFAVRGRCVLMAVGWAPRRSIAALQHDMAVVYSGLRVEGCHETAPEPPAPWAVPAPAFPDSEFAEPEAGEADPDAA